jgi:hypothetical protein
MLLGKILCDVLSSLPNRALFHLFITRTLTP